MQNYQIQPFNPIILVNDNEVQKATKQKGQTLLEFLLIFATVVSLSLILVKGLNGQIAGRWQAIVTKIATHNDKSSKNSIRLR